MLTDIGKLGFTIINKLFDVAGLPVAQTAFEVRTQITVSPFNNDVLAYVESFVPTSNPLTCH